jgi:hypothetical protein
MIGHPTIPPRRPTNSRRFMSHPALGTRYLSDSSDHFDRADESFDAPPLGGW